MGRGESEGEMGERRDGMRVKVGVREKRRIEKEGEQEKGKGERWRRVRRKGKNDE